MASRWRNWDQEFAIDILHDPQALTLDKKRPMRVFGRGKLKLDLSECSLPGVEIIERSSGSLSSHGKYRCLGRGRGRRPNYQQMTGASLNAISKHETPSISTAGPQVLKSNCEWPSLTESLKLEEVVKRQHVSNYLNDTDQGKINDSGEGRCDEKQIHESFSVSSKEASTSIQQTSSVLGNSAKIETVEDVMVQSGEEQNMLEKNLKELTSDYLKDLDSKERWVILHGAHAKANHDLKETIGTCGKIEEFDLFKDGKALIKMEEELQCEWMISCMDGSQLSESSSTISILRVCDVIDESPDGALEI